MALELVPNESVLYPGGPQQLSLTESIQQQQQQQQVQQQHIQSHRRRTRLRNYKSQTSGADGKDPKSFESNEKLSIEDALKALTLTPEGAGSAMKTPVSVLQELLSRRGITPTYDLVQIEGAIHQPTFRYRVAFADKDGKSDEMVLFDLLI